MDSNKHQELGTRELTVFLCNKIFVKCKSEYGVYVKKGIKGNQYSSVYMLMT